MYFWVRLPNPRPFCWVVTHGRGRLQSKPASKSESLAQAVATRNLRNPYRRKTLGNIRELELARVSWRKSCQGFYRSCRVPSVYWKFRHGPLHLRDPGGDLPVSENDKHSARGSFFFFCPSPQRSPLFQAPERARFCGGGLAVALGSRTQPHEPNHPSVCNGSLWIRLHTAPELAARVESPFTSSSVC